MATAICPILSAEELDSQNDEQLTQYCKSLAHQIFTTRPLPELIRDDLAAFFRYLAERGPALAQAFIVDHMKPYTTQGAEHFSEENEEYLTTLSMAIYNHEDYQQTFKIIAESMKAERDATSDV